MPRDGSASRAKIMTAARAEFLERGFEGASIRAIAAKAGVTSAALYRHFPNKEEMFAALVEPAVAMMQEWVDDHKRQAYEGMEQHQVDEVASRSLVDMMREVVFPQRETFKLIVCRSQGTRYENFIHDLVEQMQVDLIQGINWLAEYGYPVADTSHETVHMLLSAFLTALFEPIVHDYPAENAEQYLHVIERFFLPGWHDIMGI